MLNNNTITKLHEMHFSVMAQAFRDQMKNGNFAEKYPSKNVLAC